MILLAQPLIALLGNRLRVCPFLDHHPDGLTEFVELPVLAVVDVGFQPNLLYALSTLNCGSSMNPMVPLALDGMRSLSGKGCVATSYLANTSTLSLQGPFDVTIDFDLYSAMKWHTPYDHHRPNIIMHELFPCSGAPCSSVYKQVHSTAQPDGHRQVWVQGLML